MRRRKAKLLFDMERFKQASEQLQILLEPTKAANYKPEPEDGALEFMMAQCQEKAGSEPGSERLFESAIAFYQKAIVHLGTGPDRLEAYSRLASLLRDRQDDEEGADEVIEAMVNSDPQNYRVYLYHGRYLAPSDLAGAKKDLLKAVELAPAESEVYLELANLVEKESSSDEVKRQSGINEAEKLLKKGLENDPRSVPLYAALASLNKRAGRYERAVAELETGLKVLEGNEDNQKDLNGIRRLRLFSPSLRSSIATVIS